MIDLTPLRAALRQLPTTAGGSALVLATAGVPPAIALLTTGDVAVGRDSVVSCGVHAGSSVVTRLGGAFTLLVPTGAAALRVEVVAASAETHGAVAIVSGTAVALRPTAEPPWSIDLRFAPDPPDDPRLERYVAYWQNMRAWLEDPGLQPPQPPV